MKNSIQKQAAVMQYRVVPFRMGSAGTGFGSGTTSKLGCAWHGAWVHGWWCMVWMPGFGGILVKGWFWSFIGLDVATFL